MKGSVILIEGTFGQLISFKSLKCLRLEVVCDEEVLQSVFKKRAS